MASPALELRQLACVRGGRRLFHDLSLALPRAHLLRVRGGNGSGKTSLLRMVCGLLGPWAGAVLWQGQRIEQQRERLHRELLYLGHAPALKPDLDAIDNLRAACRLAGQDLPTESLRNALAAMGMQEATHRQVRLLSKGQGQRIALARLHLSHDRPLWVLDEPFDSLDADAVQQLVHAIEAQVRRGGLVLVTHHQPLPAWDARLSVSEIAL